MDNFGEGNQIEGIVRTETKYKKKKKPIFDKVLKIMGLSPDKIKEKD